MPLVSVIVPVYRVEKVLHYCIDSILNQTIEDFELILVDDGSPDDCGKVCDCYAEKDNRIKVLHRNNQGVSAARNAGLDVATGKYIVFVDSDDYVANTYLEELTTYMSCNVHFVVCGYYRAFDYSSNTEGIVKYPSEKEIVNCSKYDLMYLTHLVLMSQPWNKIFDKQIIDDYHIRMDEKRSIGEDMLFVFDYCSHILNEKFIIVNKPLYYYIVNNSSSLLNKYREDLFELNCDLNFKMEKKVLVMGLPKQNLIYFYASCFFRMESVLENTMKAPFGMLKKIRLNKALIRNQNFQYWYKKFPGKMNFVYRFCYDRKFYFPIYLLERFRGKNDK